MKIAGIPRRQPALKSIVLFFAMVLAAGVCAESLQSFEASSGLYGYKNSKGQIKIPPRFVYAEEFNRYGFASVIESGKPYFIDQQGRHVVQMFFFDNGPDPFEEGLARFVEKGKMGFFDERGRKSSRLHLILHLRFRMVWRRRATDASRAPWASIL
jgi:hypothetical protein